jgi:hypothetical protein
LFSLSFSSILYWLRERSINLDSFTPENYRSLAETILGTATGLTEYGDISIRRIQAAMIAIMRQLSSYSIQFVAEVGYEKTLQLDSPMVRLAEKKSKSKSLLYIDDYLAELIRLESKGTKEIKYKILDSNEYDIYVNFKGYHNSVYSVYCF